LIPFINHLEKKVNKFAGIFFAFGKTVGGLAYLSNPGEIPDIKST